MRFIATCHPASEELAKHEMRNLGCTDLSLLGEGIILAHSELEFDNLHSAGLLFVRHLANIEHELSIAERGMSSDTVGAQILKSLLSCLGERPAALVALQLRTQGLSDSNFKRELIAILNSGLTAAGITLARKAPELIASVMITGASVFIGICTPQQALSSWPGGEVRYRHDEQQMVSRAELKLVEAREVLNFSPNRDFPVLDLGAAPGGWTRILAQSQYRVVAVDPALLDEHVARMRGVVHHRTVADRFLSTYRGESFGAIVNDMRMDPVASAQIMRDCAAFLMPLGLGLMTLKLQKEGAQGATKHGVEKTFAVIKQTFVVLSEVFSVSSARQLFHNRSEITLVLRLDPAVKIGSASQEGSA